MVTGSSQPDPNSGFGFLTKTFYFGMSSKKMKLTKLINNEDYAFLDHGVIYINIQKLWQETLCEKKFIEQFAKSHTHELIHLVLFEEELQGTALGEEKVIRGILGEEWNSVLESIYQGEEI